MFCINCGTKLPDNAKFCSNCGTPVGAQTQNLSNTSVMHTASALVPAKCTNCGGNLTVDPNQRQAVCPYCNTSFLVQQAITNYNVSINGPVNIASANITMDSRSEHTLLDKAKEYASCKKWSMAADYFIQALQINPSSIDARSGLLNSLTRIADIFEKVKDYNTAIELYNKMAHLNIAEDTYALKRKAEILTEKEMTEPYLTAEVGLIFKDKAIFNNNCLVVKKSEKKEARYDYNKMDVIEVKEQILTFKYNAGFFSKQDHYFTFNTEEEAQYAHKIACFRKLGKKPERKVIGLPYSQDIEDLRYFVHKLDPYKVMFSGL